MKRINRHIILLLILISNSGVAQNTNSKYGKMETSIIDDYIEKYQNFRDSNNWESLRFTGLNQEEEINKQIERYKLGVGIFNELNLSQDYDLISFLFDQEVQLRKSKVQNQNPDVLYLYAFFLSRFKNIEDVWRFLDVKYIDFDSGVGFDTYYFMRFGVNEIYEYVNETKNAKKELLIKTIGTKKEDILFDPEEFERWEQGKVEYYDFVKPISRPLNFYRLFDHKELYKIEFTKWVKMADLTDRRTAYDCIHMAEYAEDKETLIEALRNYLEHDKEGVLHDQFKKRLSELTDN